MNLEGKIIETEEAKEYFVSKEIKKNNKIYLYATDIKIHKNINFYELMNGKMFPVINDELLKELLFEVIKD